MISFNPGVNDRSGEIIGNARAQAAAVNAQAMAGLGEDIGSALVGIAGIYSQQKGMQAQGKATKQAMEIIAPAIGISTTQLAALAGKDELKTDMDWYHFGEVVGPILPSIVNANSYQQKSQQTMAAPYNRAVINNAQDVVNQGGAGAIGATRRIPQGY